MGFPFPLSVRFAAGRHGSTSSALDGPRSRRNGPQSDSRLPVLVQVSVRLNARADANQKDIVKTLRKLGASVHSLHREGQGCPDLIAGISGRNYLIEVKDGTRPPSKQRLTPAEQSWKDSWRGQYVVLNSVEGAVVFYRWALVQSAGFEPAASKVITLGTLTGLSYDCVDSI